MLYRSDRQFAISSAADNNISVVRPIFDSLNWTEESYRMLERVGQTGEQLLICSAPTAPVSSFIFMHVYNIIHLHTCGIIAIMLCL